jgi:hypothetical protein
VINRTVNLDGRGTMIQGSEDPATRADQGELLSDILQAQRCLLIDKRAEHLKPQISWYGMTAHEARHELEQAVKALDALEQQD